MNPTGDDQPHGAGRPRQENEGPSDPLDRPPAAEADGFEEALARLLRDDRPRPDRALIDATVQAMQGFDFDAELAHLVEDSADNELAIRGSASRQLVFETDEVAFDVILEDNALAGQIVPRVDDTIEIVGRDEAPLEAMADDNGYFRCDDMPPGAFYLKLKATGVRTAWIAR